MIPSLSSLSISFSTLPFRAKGIVRTLQNIGFTPAGFAFAFLDAKHACLMCPIFPKKLHLLEINLQFSFAWQCPYPKEGCGTPLVPTGFSPSTCIITTKVLEKIDLLNRRVTTRS
ncbi:hypothetical protein TNCT_200821 [Trichonephila clavata]|uniref:Uncharacterized protein n=1 Tax=Trichonephila clavata TaxID=2740835 RepID=A0A8X6I4D8_TRICU|nr:hypothetical protein TNCT_200821 [Trichonephila clavata]